MEEARKAQKVEDQKPQEGSYYMVGPFTRKQVGVAVALAALALLEGAVLVWAAWDAVGSLDDIRHILETQ